MREIIYPSAEQVAVAIIAAARATGADPLAIAAPRPRDHFERAAISRMRTYAAMALLKYFDCGLSAIDRMVGAPAVGSFTAGMRVHVQKRMLGWYDPQVERAIIEAIADHAIEPKAAPAAESRSYVSLNPPPKDIKSSLLYDAVRNTPTRAAE